MHLKSGNFATVSLQVLFIADVTIRPIYRNVSQFWRIINIVVGVGYDLRNLGPVVLADKATRKLCAW